MPRIEICVIDHRDHDHQPAGSIIDTWYWKPGMPPGTEYADYCALWERWEHHNRYPPEDTPEINGFFGYRKYIVFDPIEGAERAHAPNWWQCSEEAFDGYRDWLAGWDGAEIKRLLAIYDILQAAPFPLTCGILNDFAVSRSRNDATTIGQAFLRAGISVRRHQIYPYLFITRWSVFDRMMREIEPIRLELHGKCRGEDSTNEEYKKRPMAYVMERVYSLWLENSGLSIKEMPLLHCWEKH